MKKILLLFCIFIFTFSYADTKNLIAVGLSFGSNAVSSFKVSAESGINIEGVGLVQGEVDIKKSGANSLEILSAEEEKIIEVPSTGIRITTNQAGEYIRYNNTKYRGELVIYRLDGSDITVVNELNMEEYLYGVVPKELSGGNPIEALKAQSVAARSYANYSLGKYKKWNFDVTSTTLDQVYGGYSAENKNTTQAVDETKGEVATYNGKAIQTPFFASSWGYTENSENVWNEALPYLVAVDDKYQETINEWKVIYTKSEIEALLAKAGAKIGNLKGLSVKKRSDTGAIITLEFIGSSGNFSIEKDRIRSFFNLRSQAFTISNSDENSVYVLSKGGKATQASAKNLNVISKSGIQKLSGDLSGLFFQSKDKVNTYSCLSDEYIFNGKGWGHGVGMSQMGAVGMAKEGFDYKDIIKWYYTGVEIEKLL